MKNNVFEKTQKDEKNSNFELLSFEDVKNLTKKQFLYLYSKTFFDLIPNLIFILYKESKNALKIFDEYTNENEKYFDKYENIIFEELRKTIKYEIQQISSLYNILKTL